MVQDQPSVYLTWPTTFQAIPDSLPPVVPPPLDERTFRAPFGISPDLYNFALQPQIPLVFASAYVVTVFALNAYNRKRNHEPWWISKTAAFNYFVVVHNVVLALYSFATFGAMARAIMHTWPGFDNPNGAAGMADALCKMHGPRGLGDAATYNTTINIWEIKNAGMHLLPSGNPDPTDVGRLWNEGLAFWGWIFYVSKFYEVIDTLIILAKGKRSATLQTYHHAGAMLCMWAGIRYMSPPIWMFVFINSGIHAMMYTYFTASALGVKVPQGLKRTLTSLQIAQFVFGASYAAAHLFVAYDIPMQTPYQVVSAVERAVSTASSAASGITSTVKEIVETPTITASIGSLVKKLLLRAAGEEGVAERVAMSKPDAAGYIPSAPQIEKKLEKIWERRFETQYRSELTRVNCIDTTGEAFAIYLNLLYLAPLTWLFGRFFVKAYTARGRNAKARSVSEAAKRASDAADDARKDTEQSFEKGGIEAEDELARRSSQSKQKGEEVYEQLRKDVKSMKDGTFRDRRVSERVQSFEGKVKTAAEKARDGVKSMTNGSRSSSKSASEQKNEASSVVGEVAEKAKESAKDASDQKGDESAVVDDAQETSGAGQEKKEGDEEPKESEAPQSEKKAEEGNAPKHSEAPASEEKDDAAETEDSSEPAEKQEENLAESDAVRPAPESESDSKDDDQETGDQAPGLLSGAQTSKDDEDDDRTYSEVVTGDQSAEGGADSKADEEAPSTPKAEDDTDAMGRSGVGIESEDASSPSQSQEQEQSSGTEEPSTKSNTAEK